MTETDRLNQELADKTSREILVVVNQARQMLANSIYELLIQIQADGGGLDCAIGVMSRAIKEGKFLLGDGGGQDGK